MKYFLHLRSNGKEKRVIFFNFRQPPNTLHIHSSDRERTWPEAHCHVCDCRAFSTMTLTEYSPRTRHNLSSRRSPDFNPSRRTLCINTRMCSPLANQAATGPSLDRFCFHRTKLQLQLRLFHPTYCTPLLVVRSDFITLRSKTMGTKSSPDNDEKVLPLKEVIIRCIKWSSKCLLERCGLNVPRFFEKFEKLLFPISSQSIAVSMTPQGCVAAEVKRCYR